MLVFDDVTCCGGTAGWGDCLVEKSRLRDLKSKPPAVTTVKTHDHQNVVYTYSHEVKKIDIVFISY